MVTPQVRETLKTIALVAIIAGIVAFTLGMRYGENQVSKTQDAVRAALKTAAPAPALSKE